MKKAQSAFINNLLSRLDEPSLGLSNAIYEKLLMVDGKGELSQISTSFLMSFKNIQSPLLETAEVLGTANFLIWMAYSLYDGVIDDDLPLDTILTANILERHALEIYRESTLDWNLAVEFLDTTDLANAREVSLCRFDPPKATLKIENIPPLQSFEKMLSSRSIAHVIGPMLLSKLTHDTKQQRIVHKGLANYCVARQLNDDLYDWIDDFKNGRLTYVVAYLLKASGYIPNTFIRTSVLLQKMKKEFYVSGIECICDKVEAHINSAKQALSHCGIRERTPFVKEFLHPILVSAQKAKEIHISNKEFVTAYTQISH